MADPSTYRPKPGAIPTDPGVYRFRDQHGRVIYVGKAKSLRPRLSSYFQDVAALHPRTATMVMTAASVEWTVVQTEVEALQLEYSWIKQFDPRFNVKYRDDKSYPFLAVTMSDQYPRAQVMRGAKRKGTTYFGPYSHAWAIRETLDLLLRVFPMRTCSSGVFKRAAASGRPCLLGYIDKCSAPCVGRVSEQEHRAIAEDFCDFMAGNTSRFSKRLEQQMRQAAAQLDFEQAARLRDDLQAMAKALEKQTVVLGDATDADVFALADDPLEAAVQVFHVRGGRVRGQRGWVVEKESEDVPTLMGHLLQQVYGEGDRDSIPREVLVPVLPADDEVVEQWLSEARGSRVDLRVPQRGDKRALMQTVERNAQQSLARHKVARAGDLTLRSQALTELQDALGLEDAPLRIECFDVSHVQGTNVVASMVVFEDGLPRKSEYRRFIVRGETAAPTTPTTPTAPDAAPAAASGAGAHEPGPAASGTDVREPGPAASGTDVREPGPAASGSDDGPGTVDDTAAMREVLGRRFRRLLDAEESGVGENQGPDEGGTASAQATEPGSPIDPETGRPRKFAYPPNLVVVDGGLPQVRVAQGVLDELGITGIAVVGLAKRLEEVWVPGDDFPVILPRTSEGLYLLQRLRDEAHRFAITFHRQRRSKAMTVSALDGVPGLGETRKRALMKHFGSVKRLREATVAEVMLVPGIGESLARTVVTHLAGQEQPVPAVNVTTGEVLE